MSKQTLPSSKFKISTSDSLKNVEIDFKRCAKCKKLKPRTLEYFPPRKIGSLDGLRNQCKICARAYFRQHYRNNREKYKQDQQIRYQNNRETLIAKAILWQKKNKEKRKIVTKRYVERHSDKIKESRHRWEQEHKEERRCNVRLRRARKRVADGKHTAIDVQRQGDLQGWQCYWKLPGCAVDCSVKYHVDHIVPLSKGGSNWPSNIVIACPHCNMSKGNKLPEELFANSSY